MPIIVYSPEQISSTDVRTTMNIDDDLLNRAQELTGISEKTAIVKMGIEALIAQESARRLARLGSTDPILPSERDGLVNTR